MVPGIIGKDVGAVNGNSDEWADELDALRGAELCVPPDDAGNVTDDTIPFLSTAIFMGPETEHNARWTALYVAVKDAKDVMSGDSGKVIGVVFAGVRLKVYG